MVTTDEVIGKCNRLAVLCDARGDTESANEWRVAADALDHLRPLLDD